MKSEQRFFYVLVGCTLLLSYATLILVSHISQSFVVLGVLPLGTGLLAFREFRVLAQRSILEKIRSNWGKVQREKRDFEDIRRYFDVCGGDSTVFCIDDRTWDDFTMDAVFSKMDRTFTALGKQSLYRMLRAQSFSQEVLKKRGGAIRTFQESPRLREAVQTIFFKFGKDQGFLLSSFLWEPPKVESSLWIPMYNVLFILAVVSPAAFLVSPSTGFLLVSMVFSLNMYLHYKQEQRIAGHFDSIKAASRLVHWANKLVKVDYPELREYQERMKQALAETKGFASTVSRIGVQSTDPFFGPILQYRSIFYLTEIRSYYRACRVIIAKRKAFQELFEVFGEIDALLSVASYRDGLEYYCEPTFSEGKVVDCTSAYHPLVENPVPNTLKVEQRGILITGSNMSGKSTFLRAMGINALLAQTIFTCHARAYHTSFVQLISSIGRTDNVIEGKSYYLVEAQSILRILDVAGSERLTLCIIDEMYRGTNSEERIAAAHSVLEYLSKRKFFVLAATHDLELTELLDSCYANYHFRDSVGSDGLIFDFKLQVGPARTRNAIALLEYLGYPAEVTNRAALDISSSIN